MTIRSISHLSSRASRIVSTNVAKSTVFLALAIGANAAASAHEPTPAQKLASLNSEASKVKGPSEQYIKGFVDYCKTAVAKPTATVSLLANFPDVTIKRTPLRDIGRIARGDGDVSHVVTPGLTQTRQQVTPTLDYSYIEDPSTGLICSTMQVHYEVGYGAVFVHLATELNEGGVGYKAVLQHESEHVDIYRRDLVGLRERVASAAARAIDGQYLVSRSLDEAIAKHKAIAVGLVQSTVVPAMSEVELAQHDHDNDQELAAVNAKLIESGELREPLLKMLAELERSRVARR